MLFLLSFFLVKVLKNFRFLSFSFNAIELGLGNTRQKIHTTFTSKGYTFRSDLTTGNFPRSIGTSTDGSVKIELIGTDYNIRTASYTATATLANASEIGENMVYFLDVVTTAWTDRFTWIEKNLKDVVAINGGIKKVETNLFTGELRFSYSDISLVFKAK